MKKLIEVTNLCVYFTQEKKRQRAINHISFDLYDNEILGVVGESGSGKTVMAQALLHQLPFAGRVIEGDIHFSNENLRIGYIFQDPATALTPTMRIGKQVNETLKNKQAAKELMTKVGADPSWYNKYPHELSGGEKQRVATTIALSCRPDLLIADEPTTALDVANQALILSLLKNLHIPLIVISHDLRMIAGMCDRLLVIYAGRILESGPVQTILQNPKHPYTQTLLSASFSIEDPSPLATTRIITAEAMEETKGCAFFRRCEHATKYCETKAPPFSQESSCACWLYSQKEAECR